MPCSDVAASMAHVVRLISGAHIVCASSYGDEIRIVVCTLRAACIVEFCRHRNVSRNLNCIRCIAAYLQIVVVMLLVSGVSHGVSLLVCRVWCLMVVVVVGGGVASPDDAHSYVEH